MEADMPDSRFKPYEQHQQRLLPLDLGDLIPEGHLVRVVDELVESLDLTALTSCYPGGGAPAYDPRMMLKVVIYAYTTGVYSSRKISDATASDIRFMWLTGCVRLDHMTINRFRTERLRGCFEGVFAQTVQFLADAGLVTLDEYFLDGTKLEANANKYTFVWKKAVVRNRDKLRVNVARLLDEADAADGEDGTMFPDLPETAEITSEDIRRAAHAISERLREKSERGERDRPLERAARKIERDMLPRMERYEADLADMGDRNSLSKTDRDATFMRMKEDHMLNGQLKAGYNVQNGTENQFVLHCTVHQRPGDTACMLPHLESFRETYGRLPAAVCADAGYGSEQNYEALEAEGVTAYVKYGMFHKEQKRSWKADPSKTSNWTYDADADEWTCGAGRTLSRVATRRRRSDLGYETVLGVYECADCSGCEHVSRCIRTEGAAFRRFEVSAKLVRYKKRAAELLTSEEGREMRKRRATDVETVFGDLKRNWNFRRFTLRGLEKVAHEWRLLMMGHNVRKLARALEA
jgi:transposase